MAAGDVCTALFSFSWLDKTPVKYVAWAPNEPNFANNDENCVVMYTQTGGWCNNIQSVWCGIGLGGLNV